MGKRNTPYIKTQEFIVSLTGLNSLIHYFSSSYNDTKILLHKY